MRDRRSVEVRIGFLGAFQSLRGGSWNEAVAAHTSDVLPALARGAALRTLRRTLTAARFAPGDRLDLRLAGYSWGAWTALQLASFVLRRGRRIHPVLPDAQLTITLGLLDPVGTLRLPAPLPDDPRVHAWCTFQTNGCYALCPGPSAWYVGRAIPGSVENLDVSREGRERPETDGVPPERAPDHIQLGYRAWGGHDVRMASVLARGAAGPATSATRP